MIKKIILTFFTFIALLYLVDVFIVGFDFTFPSSLILFAFILSIIELTIKPTIKFLTFPINFLTFGLFNFVISCILLYGLNLIISGVQIKSGSIGPFYTSAFEIPQIKMSLIGVIICASFCLSFLNSIVNWAQSKKSSGDKTK